MRWPCALMECAHTCVRVALDNHVCACALLCATAQNDLVDANSVDTFTLKEVVAKLHTAGVTQVMYMGTKPAPDAKKLHSKCRQHDALLREHSTALARGVPGTGQPPPFVIVEACASFEALRNNKTLHEKDKLRFSAVGHGHWNV